MSSPRFREAFSRHGVQAVSPPDEAARRSTIELIQDLKLGKLEGAAKRLAAIAEESCQQFAGQPLVCLACTELPLAFPEWKKFPFFGVDDIVYINTAILHANAAFNFAIE